MADVLLVEMVVRTDAMGTTETLRLCSGREYLGANRPGDYAPAVIGFANMRRDAFSAGATSGEIETGAGTVRIANAGGAFDAWIDYGFDGGAISLLLVDGEAGDYSNAEELLVGTMEQAEFTFTEITVRLRDRREETELPIQETLFAGTNSGSTGVEGLPADLQGRPKPRALGYVFNALLPWANEANRVLQAEAVRANDIVAVYDGGVALSKGTKHATRAALLAASVTSGYFDYYLGDDAGGGEDGAYIKLAAAPQYAITADIEGYAPGGTFHTLPGDLFEAVLEDFRGIASGDINDSDLSTVNSASAYDLGKWIDSETPARDILTRIANSLPGWWGPDKSGTFRLKVLEDPSAKSAAITFKVFDLDTRATSSDGDIISIERLVTRDAGAGVPAWRVNVLYKEFAHVQADGLDVAATPARRAQSAVRWRQVSASDSSVKTKHLLAPELTFETMCTTEADAQAVADDLLDLYSVRRDRFRLRVRLTADVIGTIDLGTYVELKFERFGLSAGKTGVILGIRYRSAAEDEDRADNELELDWWG